MFNSSRRSLMKEELKNRRLILSLKGLSCEKALSVAQAAYECGIKTFEVSLKSPYSGKMIEMLKERLDEQAIIGAGDIFCTPESNHDVTYACQCGAMFLDTPIWHKGFTDRARVYDCPTICGAEILSEMYTAHRYDASFIRLPLLSRVTADTIRDICAVIDHVRICLYGDIPSDKLCEYFGAGLSLYVLDSDIVRDLANKEKLSELAEYLRSVSNVVFEG